MYKRRFDESEELDYHKKLKSILKNIPAKYKKGVDFELTSKPLRLISYYHHNTIYIDVNEFKLSRFTMSSNSEELKKYYKSFILSSGESYNFKIEDNKDYSKQYWLHVISHELGHYYLDRLRQNDEELYSSFLKKAEKVLKSFNTKTTSSYHDYYNDEDNMMSKSPIKNIKILKEKIAEAFRLFIIEGKFSALFK